MVGSNNAEVFMSTNTKLDKRKITVRPEDVDQALIEEDVVIDNYSTLMMGHRYMLKI